MMNRRDLGRSGAPSLQYSSVNGRRVRILAQALLTQPLGLVAANQPVEPQAVQKVPHCGPAFAAGGWPAQKSADLTDTLSTAATAFALITT